MKILKKNKQQMLTGLLKHTSPPAPAATAAASASDQNSNAQTTLPTIPRGHLVVGPKDQLRLLTPVGSTATSNHCTAVAVHSVRHSLAAPQGPPSIQSEDDDGGGRGRVKKKRKKKDKREWERGGVGEEKESSKPKKRKEEKAATVITLKRRKDPKESKEHRNKGREGRNQTEAPLRNATVGVPGAAQGAIKVPGKRGRKPKVKVLPPVPSPLELRTPSALGHHAKAPGTLSVAQSHGKNPSPANSKTAAPSAPKQRGRKPRDPGAAPVQKKKKGKRRTPQAAVQDGLEHDDATSMSTLNMGGDDSQDSLDIAVSAQQGAK